MTTILVLPATALNSYLAHRRAQALATAQKIELRAQALARQGSHVRAPLLRLSCHEILVQAGVHKR